MKIYFYHDAVPPSQARGYVRCCSACAAEACWCFLTSCPSNQGGRWQATYLTGLSAEVARPHLSICGVTLCPTQCCSVLTLREARGVVRPSWWAMSCAPGQQLYFSDLVALVSCHHHAVISHCENRFGGWTPASGCRLWWRWSSEELANPFRWRIKVCVWSF